MGFKAYNSVQFFFFFLVVVFAFVCFAQNIHTGNENMLIGEEYKGPQFNPSDTHQLPPLILQDYPPAGPNPRHKPHLPPPANENNLSVQDYADPKPNPRHKPPPQQPTNENKLSIQDYADPGSNPRHQHPPPLMTNENELILQDYPPV
ncbi:early nodule-specific protein 2-like [Cannabis sativa]|uniref:early nodule-specific protein 2-like n=1 Tax=Cannabis sativa TaxID=3483 RepID=UPI0029CA8C83|nr:early nodule-specific protein 2-like [Cannabis sativa]